MSSKASDNLLTGVNVSKNAKLPQEDDESSDDASLKLIESGWKEMLCGAGDAVFASLVVAPGVVGIWRGAWGLMDMNPHLFPFAQTFILGIIINACFAILRSFLYSRSRGAWSGGAGRWLLERLLSRIYMCIFMLACIMHWRGGWGLLDAFVETVLPDETDPHRPTLIAAILMLCILALICLRSARNLLASPYFLFTDGKECTYVFTTRFRKTVSWMKYSSEFLDPLLDLVNTSHLQQSLIKLICAISLP